MTEDIHDLYGEVDQEAMYQYAISRPLEEKIQQAIMLIQTFEQQALALSPDGYYVCFSGGKDSIVMAKLFEMAGVKYQLHLNNTTMDPPELLTYVKRYWPQTIWHNPPQGNMGVYVGKTTAGLPTRLRRWCCEIYKESNGLGLVKAIGVRAQESPRRKGLWQTVQRGLKKEDRDGLFVCPILYWSEDDVWTFIRVNKMDYCCLYDEGFRRLGCIGCPMNQKGRAEDFKRWPKYEAMWRRGARTYFDKMRFTPTKQGKERVWLNSFNNFEQFWAWWMEEKNVDDTDQPDCQMWLW